MDFNDMFEKIFPGTKEREKQAKLQRPKALGILKCKFLYAIGKKEQRTTEEEEEFVKQWNDNNNYPAIFDFVMSSSTSLKWSDTIAHQAVKRILDEHNTFDISLYLDCARAVYLTYSGNEVSEIYIALTYILTHARLFGDQSRNMFQLECNNKSEPKIKIGAVTAPLPNTKYMKKVSKLIQDLRTAYDETKYRILNGNVTYITLLILRRFVKSSSQFLYALNLINTHDDYVKLCPCPLDSELPRIDKHFNTRLVSSQLRTTAFLACHAYVTVEDETSKRILRGTCIQYIEWTGLQLPDLFFRVVKLYDVDEATLWDHLCFEAGYKSLVKLAESYDKLYVKDDSRETAVWFPYCRALDGSYESDLSAKNNREVCMLLAYLVDLKIGFDKSHVRDSLWMQERLGCRDLYLNFAKAIYEKLTE